MHSLEAHYLRLLSHPSPLSFFLPLFMLQILMLVIPSCTAAHAHPSTTQVAASKAEAKAACCAVCFSSFLKLSRFLRREMLKTSLQEREVFRSALILRRWLQQIARSKRSPSLFCFHFFFFFSFTTFFTFLSPPECAMRELPE